MYIIVTPGCPLGFYKLITMIILQARSIIFESGSKTHPKNLDYAKNGTSPLGFNELTKLYSISK